MTIRGTAALAVALAALVAYLRLTAPASGPTIDQATRLTPPLDGATAILTTNDGRTTEIALKDGRWSQPGAADFLAALASLRVLAVIDDADPASYGFGADAPQLRVSVGSPGTELEFAL